MTSLQIDSIETVILDLPLRRLQRFSALGAQTQSIVLIRIKTNEGIEGIGESVTPSGPWWGGESVESIKVTIDSYLGPCLIGEDPIQIANIMRSMDRVAFGNHFAKAGIEMAVLDIIGKITGQPVCNLLGGHVRESLPVAWPLATGDPQQEIDEAHKMLADGYCTYFKLKMGALPPAQDIDRAEKIARALDGVAKVRVDPNEMWSESVAVMAVPRLAAAGIELIEQPIARWNRAASARLTAATQDTEIMIDEGLCSVRDMLEIARTRAAGIVSIKIMKSGGIRVSKTIADIAESSGISVYMGTFLESSLGTAANMQLCATFAELPYGGELVGPMLIAEDICTEPARYANGQLWLRQGPGIAVELDEDKVRSLTRA